MIVELKFGRARLDNMTSFTTLNRSNPIKSKNPIKYLDVLSSGPRIFPLFNEDNTSYNSIKVTSLKGNSLSSSDAILGK